MEIENWIKEIIDGTGGFKNCEEYEVMVHHVNREVSIAGWVIRCLGNPECEGSQDVLDSIIERRKEVLGKQTKQNQLP